jgi:hypothetical protein
VAALLALFAVVAAGCGALPFDAQPAGGYVYGSNAPLRVAVIDATAKDGWSAAIDASVATYGAGSPYLAFQHDAAGANIVVTIRDYSDSAPPALVGYLFPPNAGGFAAVYDAVGAACNFPPSPLPLNCTGEIARADVYLNNIIPAGSDIEGRRERLILHEVGHALGLTRHSPDLDIEQLAQRYGWGASQ